MRFRTFPTAGRYTERWHTAPLGPAVAGYNALAAPDGQLAWLSPARRDGDQIDVAVPLLVDGGAAHFGEASPWWPAPGTSGSTTLSRNDEVIGLSDQPGIESITVDPERATYRLDVSQTRSVPWSDLATAQQVSWTFASEHAEGPEPTFASAWCRRHRRPSAPSSISTPTPKGPGRTNAR